MTKKPVQILAIVICGLFCRVPASKAGLVIIGITAEVTEVLDFGPLEGKINIGDIMTGVYIYDSSTPDSNPDPKIGYYQYDTPPYGITLTVGGFVFMTNPDKVEFGIGVANNPPLPLSGGYRDSYGLGSANNLPLYNSVPVDSISLHLSGPPTLISSDALPTTAPVLDDWELRNNIRIDGGYPYARLRGWFEIEGHLTSAVLIPEPAMIEADVDIKPDTVNLQSKGKWITCYILLPEGYDVIDIDPNSVFLEDEIQAQSVRVDEQEQVAMAKFSRSEVQDILDVGQVELTITGQLTDRTLFEGTDVIRVIDKGRGK